MSTPKIEVVRTGWGNCIGFYIDGVLKIQQRELGWDDLAYALGLGYTYVDPPESWIESTGELPSSSDEIPGEREEIDP